MSVCSLLVRYQSRLKTRIRVNQASSLKQSMKKTQTLLLLLLLLLAMMKMKDHVSVSHSVVVTGIFY